ncbi:conserved hypothetical protein [Vibrio phage 466E53-1]|nr:conserved hypothetical protein [Vibrio phage 466E53-1]
MITCKEDLIGTEFKITCKEEADLLKEKCESLGVKHATWSSCNYTGGIMRGVIAKDLGTYHSCKLLFTDKPENSYSMDEFKSLRLVDIKDLVKSTPTKFVKVEESIFDLKEEFERGELYAVNGREKHFVINNEGWLTNAKSNGNVYRQVKVDWRDEVNKAYGAVELPSGERGKLYMGESWDEQEFIKFCHLVASLTEKPEGV